MNSIKDNRFGGNRSGKSDQLAKAIVEHLKVNPTVKCAVIRSGKPTIEITAEPTRNDEPSDDQ